MIQKFICHMPKVELHLHLEGAIPLEALWEIIRKYQDKNKEVKSLEDLRRKFEYKDFPDFLEKWVWKNKFLRQYEDFTFIAREVAHDLAKQNIQYVEIFYSPGDFLWHGLEINRLTESIRKGFDQYSNRITIQLVADLVRDFGPDLGLRWLEEINEVKDQGVIGIGIGGTEYNYPPDVYLHVYEKAREFGFKTSAHAGEGSGPQSIWGAIKSLKVDRIGHGTRAIEDPKLVAYLKEIQLPIELCPISNVRTGIVKNLNYHPVKRYIDQGLLVSINTDDPKMFNTSLDEEYSALLETFKYGLGDLKCVAENAIVSSWCEEDLKCRLKNQLNFYFEKNSSKNPV